MADDNTSPSMKPQDTVIFLLGELKGGVASLQTSVNASNVAQAAVNKANEEEHAKFRQQISEHGSALAVLADGKKTQQDNKLTNLQRAGLWISVPSGLAALIGLAALWITNK